MGKDFLPLKAALKAGKLDDFITQAEAEGVAPATAAEVLAGLEAMVRPRRSEDQTSRSPSGDGSA